MRAPVPRCRNDLGRVLRAAGSRNVEMSGELAGWSGVLTARQPGATQGCLAFQLGCHPCSVAQSSARTIATSLFPRGATPNEQKVPGAVIGREGWGGPGQGAARSSLPRRQKPGHHSGRRRTQPGTDGTAGNGSRLHPVPSLVGVGLCLGLGVTTGSFPPQRGLCTLHSSLPGKSFQVVPFPPGPRHQKSDPRRDPAQLARPGRFFSLSLFFTILPRDAAPPAVPSAIYGPCQRGGIVSAHRTPHLARRYGTCIGGGIDSFACGIAQDGRSRSRDGWTCTKCARVSAATPTPDLSISSWVAVPSLAHVFDSRNGGPSSGDRHNQT